LNSWHGSFFGRTARLEWCLGRKLDAATDRRTGTSGVKKQRACSKRTGIICLATAQPGPKAPATPK
jgi:hypothetical protein